MEPFKITSALYEYGTIGKCKTNTLSELFEFRKEYKTTQLKKCN